MIRRALAFRIVTTATASEMRIDPNGEWPASVVFEGTVWTAPDYFAPDGRLLHVTYYNDRRNRKLVITNDSEVSDVRPEQAQA